MSNVKVVIADGSTMVWELYGKVATDECTWTIEDGKLVITMEKCSGDTWMALIKEGGFSVLM